MAIPEVTTSPGLTVIPIPLSISEYSEAVLLGLFVRKITIFPPVFNLLMVSDDPGVWLSPT